MKCFDCGAEHDLTVWSKETCRKCRAPFVYHLEEEQQKKKKEEWEDKKKDKLSKARREEQMPIKDKALRKSVFTILGELTDDEEDEVFLETKKEEESMRKNDGVKINASPAEGAKVGQMKEADSLRKRIEAKAVYITAMEEIGEDVSTLKAEKQALEAKLEQVLKQEEQAKTRKHGIDEYQRLYDSIKQEEEDMTKKLDADLKALELQEAETSKQKKSLAEKKQQMQRRSKRLLQKCNENMKKAAEENTILQGYLQEKLPARVEAPKMPLQLATESKHKGDPAELTAMFQNLIDAIGMIAGCLPDTTQREKAAEATEGLRHIIKAAGGHGTSTRTDKPSSEEGKEDGTSKKPKIDEATGAGAGEER